MIRAYTHSSITIILYEDSYTLSRSMCFEYRQGYIFVSHALSAFSLKRTAGNVWKCSLSCGPDCIYTHASVTVHVKRIEHDRNLGSAIILLS